MRSTTVSLRDCVYGQAVGDALGVPFEFRARGTFECRGMVGNGTHGQPAGTWSDDTSMMLAICDSYRELGCIDVDDIRAKFLLWYREDVYTCGRLFDIGAATASALRLGHGLCGERDNGNGSLMRTVALAFTDATDDEVRTVSAITHAHSTSTEACVRMVHAARELIAGATPREVASGCGVSVGKSATRIACSPPSTLATTPTQRRPSPARSPASSTARTRSRRSGCLCCAARTSSRSVCSRAVA